MKSKTAILGGTFNPLHKGHIELATKVKETFKFQQILFLLSANPPHKKDISMPSATTRWDMLEQGLKKYKEFIPCDIEIKRNDYSWTIETIKELRKKNKELELYFITGSESFLKIETWKNYSQLLKEINFIILIREEKHLEEIKELSEKLNFKIYKNIKKCEEKGTGIIFKYKSNNMLLSSTIIRNMIKTGKNTQDLLPLETYKIIKEKNLYGTKD